MRRGRKLALVRAAPLTIDHLRKLTEPTAEEHAMAAARVESVIHERCGHVLDNCPCGKGSNQQEVDRRVALAIAVAKGEARYPLAQPYRHIAPTTRLGGPPAARSS